MTLHEKKIWNTYLLFENYYETISYLLVVCLKQEYSFSSQEMLILQKKYNMADEGAQDESAEKELEYIIYNI